MPQYDYSREMIIYGAIRSIAKTVGRKEDFYKIKILNINNIDPIIKNTCKIE